VLDEAIVNKILTFVVDQESKLGRPFDRFTDMSALNAVDLTFKYVFHVALYRRLSRAGREVVKSAFLVTDPEIAHYIKLHAIMTDHSPLKVSMFKERDAAAQWLGVPIGILTSQE
jgi:heptaprenylglyceryl phosphate synthase